MANIPHDWPIPLPKWVWAWMKWRLSGQSYPRPAGVPRVIPRWAWHRLQWLVSLRAKAAPRPPAPTLAKLGRNVMFTAWAPDVCLGRLPKHWTVALSADPAYDTAVRLAAPRLKQAGYRIAVWGNQSQTGAERINRLASELKADLAIFQAENAGEYGTALAAGARIVVGDPNSWTQAQRYDATARANRGELAIMFEVYANAGGQWPDTASSRNVPIVTEVLGIGGWSGAPDMQLAAYRMHTPPGVWATMGVYTAEYLSPDSWALLP